MSVPITQAFILKNHLMRHFSDLEWHDEGTFSEESVDYPDFAEKVALRMKDSPHAIGLLVCGSGEGMVIKANRYPCGTRRRFTGMEEVAEADRNHNNANVLCLAPSW